MVRCQFGSKKRKSPTCRRDSLAGASGLCESSLARRVSLEHPAAAEAAAAAGTTAEAAHASEAAHSPVAAAKSTHPAVAAHSHSHAHPHSAHAHGPAFADETLQISRDKWRKLWPWVLANALAGQTLGVTCMQWALKTTQAGIVTAITATTPIFLLPMSRIVEKEKIGLRAVIGAVVAVTGVIGLTFFR